MYLPDSEQETVLKRLELTKQNYYKQQYKGEMKNENNRKRQTHSKNL